MSNWPFLGPEPKPETFIDRLNHIKAGASYPEYGLDMKELLEFLKEVKRLYWNREDLIKKLVKAQQNTQYSI